MEDKLIASEALYEFMGYLMIIGETIKIGCKQDASIVSELLSDFIEKNKLSQPRESWYK